MTGFEAFLMWVNLARRGEVGRKFGVTCERIRQIEAKALEKLRHPHHARKLSTFLES